MIISSTYGIPTYLLGFEAIEPRFIYCLPNRSWTLTVYVKYIILIEMKNSRFHVSWDGMRRAWILKYGSAENVRLRPSVASALFGEASRQLNFALGTPSYLLSLLTLEVA